MLTEKHFIDYQKSGYRDFIKDYEIKLSEFTEKNRVYSKKTYEDGEVIETEFDSLTSKEIEKDFLSKLLESIIKRNDELISKSELDEKDQIGLLSFNYKVHFITSKLQKLDFDYKILDNQKVEFNKTTNKKKNTKLLIEGKVPNVSERYKIANETCDIYNAINKKNISAAEKHKLLAHIMGCSQQVARELFNGTQTKRTPIRDEVLNPYLEKLK